MAPMKQRVDESTNRSGVDQVFRSLLSRVTLDDFWQGQRSRQGKRDESSIKFLEMRDSLLADLRRRVEIAQDPTKLFVYKNQLNPIVFASLSAMRTGFSSLPLDSAYSSSQKKQVEANQRRMKESLAGLGAFSTGIGPDGRIFISTKGTFPTSSFKYLEENGFSCFGNGIAPEGGIFLFSHSEQGGGAKAASLLTDESLGQTGPNPYLSGLGRSARDLEVSYGIHLDYSLATGKEGWARTNFKSEKWEGLKRLEGFSDIEMLNIARLLPERCERLESRGVVFNTIQGESVRNVLIARTTKKLVHYAYPVGRRIPPENVEEYSAIDPRLGIRGFGSTPEEAIRDMAGAICYFGASSPGVMYYESESGIKSIPIFESQNKKLVEMASNASLALGMTWLGSFWFPPLEAVSLIGFASLSGIKLFEAREARRHLASSAQDAEAVFCLVGVAAFGVTAPVRAAARVAKAAEGAARAGKVAEVPGTLARLGSSRTGMAVGQAGDRVMLAQLSIGVALSLAPGQSLSAPALDQKFLANEKNNQGELGNSRESAIELLGKIFGRDRAEEEYRKLSGSLTLRGASVPGDSDFAASLIAFRAQEVLTMKNSTVFPEGAIHAPEHRSILSAASYFLGFKSEVEGAEYYLRTGGPADSPDRIIEFYKRPYKEINDRHARIGDITDSVSRGASSDIAEKTGKRTEISGEVMMNEYIEGRLSLAHLEPLVRLRPGNSEALYGSPGEERWRREESGLLSSH